MRAHVLVLLGILLVPAASALPIGVQAESDGPPSFGWGTGGTLLPGDDVVYASGGVRTLDLRVDPVSDGLAPGLVVDANLRDLRVEEPALRFVRAADHDLDAVPLPAGLTIGQSQLILDLDVTNPVNGHGGAYHDAVDLPNPDTWGPPVTVDDASIAVEPTLTSNSDRFIERLDASTTQMCSGFGGDLRYAVAQHDQALSEGGARCPEHTLTPWLEPYLPTWAGRYELQDLRVIVARAVAFAAEGRDVAGSLPPSAWSGLPGRMLLPAMALAAPADGSALSTLGWDAQASGPSEPGADLAPSASGVALLEQQGPEVALALIAGLGLALLAIPLYRRLVQRDVAGHPVRQRILEVVTANPGIHEMQAAKQLGISHTLAQYHVRMLAEFGALEIRRFGGRKCLFVPGGVGRAEKSVLLAERAGRAGQLLDIVGQQPDVSQRELSRLLGMRESSVKWHLDRLAGQGLLVVERTAVGKRVRLSDETARVRAPVPMTLVASPASPAAAAAPGPVPAEA